MHLLIELHYLPNLAYFTALLKPETIEIEACENYQKQTFRNRCYILGANKIQSLIVPVRHLLEKQPIRDVAIDYTQRWLQVHLRSISSAYGKAPFFSEFFPELKNIYDKKYRFLFDLNAELLTICLYYLQITKNIIFTEKYHSEAQNHQKDFRNSIIPEKTPDIYQPQAYMQVFGKEFAPNLSILDLLFSEGNLATDILHSSLVS